MAKNLLIVESPAKAKTIEKYLGKDFMVRSSNGHIRDLAKNNKAIDVENNFATDYIISESKKDVVDALKKATKSVDEVWLATDEDREGEAISWHLCEALGLNAETTKRIVFREITKPAVLKAIEEPRTVDLKVVDAQQARRVIDRLVGFELSPVLWRKVRTKLSAGRVQSVTVRLIVEREREINAFSPKISYKVIGLFTVKNEHGNNVTLKADLTRNLTSEEEAQSFLESCKGAEYTIGKIDVKPAKKSPTAPFTTSTLQQEASRKLGFSVSRTMVVAQKLYEAGKITYMRTDSVNLSETAMVDIEKNIKANYGEAYVQPRKFKNKSSGAQEAHEAIRPSYIENKNIDAPSDQQRLYDLIWKRTIASQMADAQLEKTVVKIDISTNDRQLTARGEMIKFDGFLKVYRESVAAEEEVEDDGILPPLKVGQVLDFKSLTATQKFSRHSARYTEATLVKKLEELGIGRPSTYAPIISTVQRRGYVVKESREGRVRNYNVITLQNDEVVNEVKTENTGAEKNKLFPTDIGLLVNDFLREHFDLIMDYGFTAKMEAEFDEIAKGNEEWRKVVKAFYHPFHTNVETTLEKSERVTGERELGVDPKTGKKLIVRLGRYGPMAQIGSNENGDEPKYAPIKPPLSLETITFDEAINLFKLPRELGNYKDKLVVIKNGPYGPYVHYNEKYISIDRDEDPYTLSFERAAELIDEREKADAPIYQYDDLPVFKGKGRFGPFLKWNDLFINVNKKYDFSNLSNADIEELIEAKKKKEREKVVQNWEEEGIRIEKARWKRHNIIQGKIKIEIAKEIDAAALTLAEVKDIIEKRAPKPKKKAAKKTTAKKSTGKKTASKTPKKAPTKATEKE